MFQKCNRKNIKWNWHQVNIWHCCLWFKCISKSIIGHPFILAWRRMLGFCFRVSQVGITITDWGRQVAHRAKCLEASLSQADECEQSTVYQCSPWEAQSCFLSLPQLCNGKSIWLYLLFVFWSKPCSLFVLTALFMLPLFSVGILLTQSYVYMKTSNRGSHDLQYGIWKNTMKSNLYFLPNRTLTMATVWFSWWTRVHYVNVKLFL